MWIFNNDSFVSVVQDWSDPSCVYVRGRRKSDVVNFAECSEDDVKETPDNDYSFRVNIKKTAFAEIMALRAMNLDYGNFKASIPKDDIEYIRMCHEVWGSGVRNLDERFNQKNR